MIYVIDGHNLIPKIPGMRLQDEDDEFQLIELLKEYARMSRHTLEVFFDGAPPAAKSIRGGGLVHSHFIQKGVTADSAIIRFVAEKGKNAKNTIVVSSDHHVQNEVRALGSAVISSEQFAAEIVHTLSRKSSQAKKNPPPMTETELDEWLKLFGKN